MNEFNDKNNNKAMKGIFNEMDKCVNDFIGVINDVTATGRRIDSDFAWRVYNFVNHYKAGEYGEVSLQDALDKHWEDFCAKEADHEEV